MWHYAASQHAAISDFWGVGSIGLLLGGRRMAVDPLPGQNMPHEWGFLPQVDTAQFCELLIPQLSQPGNVAR